MGQALALGLHTIQYGLAVLQGSLWEAACEVAWSSSLVPLSAERAGVGAGEGTLEMKLQG